MLAAGATPHTEQAPILTQSRSCSDTTGREARVYVQSFVTVLCSSSTPAGYLRVHPEPALLVLNLLPDLCI